MAILSKVFEYRVELWQDGIMVAAVEGTAKEQAERDINHYAFMYGQDGPVEIRWIKPTTLGERG